MMDKQAMAIMDELAWYEPWRQYLRPLPLRKKQKKEGKKQVIDLGPIGERVIDILCEYGCANLSQIARKAEVSVTSAEGALQRLRDKGYVERCPSCRGVYRITDEGRVAAITPNPKVWLDEAEDA